MPLKHVAANSEICARSDGTKTNPLEPVMLFVIEGCGVCRGIEVSKIQEERWRFTADHKDWTNHRADVWIGEGLNKGVQPSWFDSGIVVREGHDLASRMANTDISRSRRSG